MKSIFPILASLAGIFLGYCAYLALVVAPTDQMQGDIYRIIYYHVPSAWPAFILFTVNLVASIIFLVWRNPKADMHALIGAEMGVVFLSVNLTTGPIWARPVWGIWWTWDWRLTSTLVVWLIYVSYLMLRRFSSAGETPVMAAVVGIFGALCVPFVYFSIWFFRTQHPQPVIGGGGSMDPQMLHVLLLNWLAFLCFGGLVYWSRYRFEVFRREVDEAQAMRELVEPRGAR